MFKFWIKTKDFDFSKSHEFFPSKKLIKSACEYAQGMTVNGDSNLETIELTEKMRKCKHDRKWFFDLGFPSYIIGCCDCSYWQFI